jgi:hypothetical protein
MGLAADFKKYVAATHGDCVRPSPGQAGYEPPDAVVVDVMVLLHSFSVRSSEEAPARRLAETVMHSVADAPVAAMCFDVSASTPPAKSLEWAVRPAPAVHVSAADVHAALEHEQLPDFPSLLASREARTVLCRWLVQRAAELLRWDRTLLVLDDGAPTVYATTATGERSATPRPDLARPLHGEADISCIFAARTLHGEWRARLVECITVDTDLVLIGALNAFDGLRVRLHHFDRATKLPVFLTVDCSALAVAGPARYGLDIMEWAALIASRGTDYVHGGVIRGVGDWDVYMTGCAEALRDVRRSRGNAPLVSDQRVETAALHTTFVAASSRLKRSKLKYEADDGTLARLAWHVLYMRHAPMRGGEGLHCLDFGWMLDQNNAVALRRTAARAFTLGGLAPP